MTYQERVITAGRLRVRFTRQADRYSHSVEQFDGEIWRTALESIEGAPDEAWPASPPLQQLHVEQRAEGRSVALLVGMAGSNHWSASIAGDPQQDTLIFDVACRTHTTPGQLASTYRLPGPAVPVSIEVDSDLGPMARVIWPAENTCTVQVDAVEAGATVRWRYTVRCRA